MSDQTLASLNIQVVSTGISQATQDLQNFARQAETAENTVIHLSETTKARMQAENLAATTQARQVLVDKLANLTQQINAESENQNKLKALRDAAFEEERKRNLTLANDKQFRLNQQEAAVKENLAKEEAAVKESYARRKAALEATFSSLPAEKTPTQVSKPLDDTKSKLISDEIDKVEKIKTMQQELAKAINEIVANQVKHRIEINNQILLNEAEVKAKQLVLAEELNSKIRLINEQSSKYSIDLINQVVKKEQEATAKIITLYEELANKKKLANIEQSIATPVQVITQPTQVTTTKPVTTDIVEVEQNKATKLKEIQQELSNQIKGIEQQLSNSINEILNTQLSQRIEIINKILLNESELKTKQLLLAEETSTKLKQLNEQSYLNTIEVIDNIVKKEQDSAAKIIALHDEIITKKKLANIEQNVAIANQSINTSVATPTPITTQAVSINTVEIEQTKATKIKEIYQQLATEIKVIEQELSNSINKILDNDLKKRIEINSQVLANKNEVLAKELNLIIELNNKIRQVNEQSAKNSIDLINSIVQKELDASTKIIEIKNATSKISSISTPSTTVAPKPVDDSNIIKSNNEIISSEQEKSEKIKSIQNSITTSLAEVLNSQLVLIKEINSQELLSEQEKITKFKEIQNSIGNIFNELLNKQLNQFKEINSQEVTINAEAKSKQLQAEIQLANDIKQLNEQAAKFHMEWLDKVVQKEQEAAIKISEAKKQAFLPASNIPVVTTTISNDKSLEDEVDKASKIKAIQQSLANSAKEILANQISQRKEIKAQEIADEVEKNEKIKALRQSLSESGKQILLNQKILIKELKQQELANEAEKNDKIKTLRQSLNTSAKEILADQVEQTKMAKAKGIDYETEALNKIKQLNESQAKFYQESLDKQVAAEKVAADKKVEIQNLVNTMTNITKKLSTDTEYYNKVKQLAEADNKLKEDLQTKQIQAEDDTANKLIQIKNRILAKENENKEHSIQLMREYNAKRIAEEEEVTFKLELEAKKRAANLGLGASYTGAASQPSQPFQVGGLASLTGADVKSKQESEHIKETEKMYADMFDHLAAKQKASEEAYQKHIIAVEEMDASLARMQKEKADQTEFYIEATLQARRIAYQTLFSDLMMIEDKFYADEKLLAEISTRRNNEILDQQLFHDKAWANSREVIYAEMFDHIAAKEKAAAESTASEQKRRTNLANTYKEETNGIIAELNQRLEMEKTIRVNGANSIQAIELKAAQEELAIWRKLEEDILAIKERISKGTITSFDAKTQTQDLTTQASGNINQVRAVPEVAKQTEEEGKARKAALMTQYRDETQLVVTELNKRIEMESAIRKYGAESNHVIALRASQEEVSLRSKMAAEILQIEKQLDKGIIASKEEAITAIKAITQRTEAEINQARAIGDTASQAENSANKHNALNNILNRTTGILSAMIAYRAFSFFADAPAQIMNTNIEMEKLHTLLKGVTGSSEKAKVEFESLAKLDLKTPFDIEGLTKTFVMLTNYGLQPTEFVMKALTDQVSKLGGGTEQLIGIGRQLGQAWAKDKLQMVDMRPMIENGLPIISLLSEALDKSAGEILAMASAGKLGREEMMKLFEQMEKNAPNAAAENMNTMHGAITNVTTAWEQLQDSLIESRGEKAWATFFTGLSDRMLFWKNSISETIDWNISLKKNTLDLANAEDLLQERKHRFMGNTSEVEKEIERLKKEREDIIKNLAIQTEAEKKLDNEKENALAKDRESLALNEKQQQAAIKKLEVEGKLEEARIASANSDIDAKINGIKRANATTIAAYEAERKLNDDKRKREEISAEARKSKEDELSQNIINIKKNELDQIAALEKTKLEKHVVDVDKAWAAIVQIESSNRSGQVNPTSLAMGPGQALPSTLTGTNASGEHVGVGYGMPDFKPAVQEHVKQVSDAYKQAMKEGDTLGMAVYYEKIKDFATKHDAELKLWSEQYFKALVVGTGSIDAALKIYGENTDAYRAKFKAAYDDLDGGTIRRNKLNEEAAKINDEKIKVEIEGNANLAASQAALEESRKKQDDIDDKAFKALNDRYAKATLSALEYNKTIQGESKVSPEKMPALLARTEEVVKAEADKKAADEATKKLEAYNSRLDHTKEKMLNLGSITKDVFGITLSGINDMASGFERMTTAIENATIKLDENSKMQELNKASADSPEKIANAKKYAEVEMNLNQKVVDAKLTGTREMASAVSGMLKKGSDAQKAAHAIEMGIAGWQMAQEGIKVAGYAMEGIKWLELHALKMGGYIQEGITHAATSLGFVAEEEAKGTAAAATAVAVASQSSPWTGWATGAAMLAAMAAIGFSLGGFGGSGNDVKPPQSSPDSGTVLGDTAAKSESVSNVVTMLKDIQAQNYPVLRSIDKGINALQSAITSTVTNVFKTGGLDLSNKGIDLSNPYKFNPLSILVGGITELFAGGYREVVERGIATPAQKVSNINENTFRGQQYNVVKTRTWDLFSDETRYDTVMTKLSDKINKSLSSIFINMGTTMFSLAQVFGKDVQTKVENYVIPALKINLTGLNAEAAAKKVNNVISTQMDKMASNVFGKVIGEYQKLGEGIFETTVRIVSEIAVVKDALSKSNLALTSEINEVIRVSDAIVQAAGGLKEFQSQFATYFDKFYSDNEKQVIAYKELTSALLEVNVALPATKEGYKTLLESLKIDTTAGQAQYSTLLKLSEAANNYYDLLKNSTQVYTDAITESKNNLQEAYKNESDAINATITKISSFVNSMKTFKDSLVLGNLSTGTPLDKYRAAESQLNKVVATIQSGMGTTAESQAAYDDAIKTVTSKMSTFLEASKVYNASGSQYTADVDKTNSILDSLNTTATSQITDSQKQLDKLTQSVDGLITLNKSVLSVKDGIDAVNKAMEALAKAQADQNALNAKNQAAAIERTAVTDATTASISTMATMADIKPLMALYNTQQDALIALIDSGAKKKAIDKAQKTVDTTSLLLDPLLNKLTATLSDVISYEVTKLGRTLTTEEGNWLSQQIQAGLKPYTIYSNIDKYAVDPTSDNLKILSTVVDTQSKLINRLSNNLTATNVPLVGPLPASLPKFASGGIHDGGWRLVGEQGPELEYTGASKIFNHAQTNAILMGNANQSKVSDGVSQEIILELKALRAEVSKLRADQKANTGALIENNYAATDAAACKVVSGANDNAKQMNWANKSKAVIR